jgi:hypothetical protein
VVPGDALAQLSGEQSAVLDASDLLVGFAESEIHILFWKICIIRVGGGGVCLYIYWDWMGVGNLVGNRGGPSKAIRI